MNLKSSAFLCLSAMTAALGAQALHAQGLSDTLTVAQSAYSTVISTSTTPALNVRNGDTGPIARCPFLFFSDNYDATTASIASFSEHNDIAIFGTVDGMSVSTNGGSTWPTYLENSANPNFAFYISSIVRIHQPVVVGGVTVLHDGDYLAMSYPTQQVSGDSSHTKINCYYWISTNKGQSWTAASSPGTVTLPAAQFTGFGANWGGFLFHRSMFQMADGSLQGTMYGKYSTDAYYRTLWVKSSDGGATWAPVATSDGLGTVGTAYNPGGTLPYNGGISGAEGFGEPCAVQTSDGSILVVMRTGGGSGYHLYQTRSTNGGSDWSTYPPVELPGATGTPGVDPDMTLADNGALVLSYGDRANGKARLLFSLDGSGGATGTAGSWATLTQTFTGEGTNTTFYTGAREVSANHLLVIGDLVKNPNYPSFMDTETITQEVATLSRKTGGAASIMKDDFDSTSVGGLPSGYTLVTGVASVQGSDSTPTALPAYDGPHSLMISDTSSGSLSNVVKLAPNAGATKQFQADIYPQQVTTANVISFNSGGNTNANSVFHIGIFPGGAVKWFNGMTWAQLGTATAVIGAWNRLNIYVKPGVTPQVAFVYLNSVYLGTANQYNSGFTTVDRVRFMSGSTAGVGDIFYVDNVFFY